MQAYQSLWMHTYYKLHIRPSFYLWLASSTEEHGISESCWSWASSGVACGLDHGVSPHLLQKPIQTFKLTFGSPSTSLIPSSLALSSSVASFVSHHGLSVPRGVCSTPMNSGWCYLISPHPTQPLDLFLQKNLIKRIDPVPFLCVQWSANTTSCVSAFLFRDIVLFPFAFSFLPLLFLKILLTYSYQVRWAFHPFPVPFSSASRMACEITWDEHVFLHVFEPSPVAFTSVIRGASHF